MEFCEEDIKRILSEITEAKDINVADIPCIDLYMDQVTSFFENKLETQRRNEEDKILTKTMINNYTKAKILMPAKNKKYTKEHLILLVLIYNLKQSLSINDIDDLFSAFSIHDEAKESQDIENIYNCFLSTKSSDKNSFNEYINKKLKTIEDVSSSINVENRNMAQMFLTVLSLINSANMEKRIAEKIIDEFFSKDKKSE